MTAKQPHEAVREALLKLSSKQSLAVSALAGGSTHAEAAAHAGVQRETVTRWCAHHSAFKAALQLQRFAVATEQRDLSSRVRSKALARIEAAIDSGDLTAAVSALRLIPATELLVPRDSASQFDDDLRERARAVRPPPPKRGADGRVSAIDPFLDQLDETRKADLAERAERIALRCLGESAGVDGAARLGDTEG